MEFPAINFILSLTLLVSPVMLTKNGTSFKIDAAGYISELTAETLKGIAKNPDPGTQQLTQYSSVIQNTTYTLTLGRVSVTGLQNISTSDVKDTEYENAPAVSAKYTIAQALVQVHTMLAPTSRPSHIAHGRAAMNLSGLAGGVVVAASRRAGDGTACRAELVEDSLERPGLLEGIDIAEGSVKDMKDYVTKLYDLFKVSISHEVTLVFKLHFENAIRKVDVSKYVITS